MAITTVVFNSVQTNRSKTAGVVVNKSGTNAPRFAQADAYKAAMWGGFALGALAALLAAVFLRGVGVVGHRPVVDAETSVDGNGECQAGEEDEEKAKDVRRETAEDGETAPHAVVKSDERDGLGG